LSAQATPTAFETLARRERIAVLVALLLVVLVSAWLMIKSGDALMMLIPSAQMLTPTGLALLFVMWWTMMMAMMLPSAAPAILTFGAVSRKLEGARSGTRIAAFTLGYALVWTLFSAFAVIVQLIVDPLLRLNPMFATTSRAAGAVLLIAAGVYQLTPLKDVCLRKCQMPLMAFARDWRPHLSGALSMGLSHGLHCTGCCAVLMAVLFYGGVMEPAWIGGLALYVLIEKITPRHWRIAHLSGAILILWGAGIFIGIPMDQ
jgi:predicted metal-binding membrane protein